MHVFIDSTTYNDDIDWERTMLANNVTIDHTSTVSRYRFIEEHKKPIVFSNFQIVMTKNNRLMLCFTLENHKYLNFAANGWDSRGYYALEDGTEIDCAHGTRIISVDSTEEVYLKGISSPFPVCQTAINLIPESEEEDQLISYDIVAAPLKWAYNILFIPASDFDYESDKDNKIPLMKEDFFYNWQF